MLKILVGTDWIANRNKILSAIAEDVAAGKANRVLIVPELISHDMERRLCQTSGDTASRFAEVLSFSRLVKRVADDIGHSAIPCLDEGGRVVAMASAINQVQSKLKYFASLGTKPEFITDLVETVDECKRCGVEPASLMNASRETTGMLAQKLEELAFIFEAYDGICRRGKKDPRDQLTWLLEELEASNYAENHVFYIDGFYDFTRQQLDVLSHLILCSSEVTISLCCDCLGSERMAFERAGDTAKTLCRIAQNNDVDVKIVDVAPLNYDIGSVANYLLDGDRCSASTSCLKVSAYETVFQECEAVSERIQKLVRYGCRYREIGIVCPDLGKYEGSLNMVFQRCGIPAYLSGTQSILDRPVIATVLTAIDAVLGGFEQKDVLAYLKTALSPISLHDCDLIENYALLWNISGKKWTQPWQMHPRGLVQEWTEGDFKLLAQLNSIRELTISPLNSLRQSFLGSKNAKEQTIVLYEFLERIGLAQSLKDLSDRLEKTGDFQNAQILDQLWEILINALEQMHDVLGESVWELETFSKLSRILISRYDVGTIPTVLDSVTVGDISGMRCQESKHLFVLGAVEGALPGYGTSAGVLTDQDRSVLRDIGVPLNGGAVESLQNTFADIYGVFSGATASVSVSYPGGQPSYVYLRLQSICDNKNEASDVLGAVVANRKHAAAYLNRNQDLSAVKTLGVESESDWINARRFFDYGDISAERVTQLYGKEFKLSASQIDVYSNCAMSYFLKFGLKAKERKPADIDPAEFGTFVHDVLEKTARRIVDMGGFKTVTKEQTIEIAQGYADQYMQQHFAGFDSLRLAYLLRRNGKELELIVEELWNELHNSEFAPFMFELSFGGNDQGFPAIQIQGEEASAKIRGFVDRVDIWQNGDASYYRVVDYKTGVKNFDYCDIINGIGLQMLLYLFALSGADSSKVGYNAVPAGVQYFPARVPVVSVENGSDENEAIKEREQCWKRSGLLLNDDAVLAAMEPENMPGRMPYKRKKDGTLTGDLADRQQFSLLKKFIFGYLRKMVDDIASGNVTANPYTRDARKNACRFCPYGAVCHKEDVEGRRIYKAIDGQHFWEDVTKEVEKYG